MNKGFTLVELAVVMVIVGLLIGGILKGQELLLNSRITRTQAEVKAIDAAVGTFRGAFGNLPGDIPNPDTRIPGCNFAPCNTATGNGDQDLEALPTVAQAFPSESAEFWSHLNVSDFIGGVDQSTDISWGLAFPASTIGGGYTVGSYQNSAVPLELAPAGNAQGGEYVNIRPDPTIDSSNPAAGLGVMSSSVAARLDRKFDDGSPVSGIMIGSGAACAVGNLYDEGTNENSCNLLIRISN